MTFSYFVGFKGLRKTCITLLMKPMRKTLVSYYLINNSLLDSFDDVENICLFYPKVQEYTYTKTTQNTENRSYIHNNYKQLLYTLTMI